MKNLRYPFLLSLMMPERNRAAVLQAALTDALPIARKQRTMFSIMNANNQENERHRQVMQAEARASSEVVSFVKDSVEGGVVSDEEVRTKYPIVSKYQLNEQLSGALSRVSITGAKRPMAEAGGEDAVLKQFMGAVELVYRKTGGNVRKSEYDQFPILKQAFAENKELEGQFESVVREIRKVAKA